jgi:hypothetical protein
LEGKMKVQVMKVVQTGKGWNLAYCQCGQLYGTIVSSAEVVEPGEYELRSTLREREGRIVPMIRVEKP